MSIITTTKFPLTQPKFYANFRGCPLRY